jgi:hypothetical protein
VTLFLTQGGGPASLCNEEDIILYINVEEACDNLCVSLCAFSVKATNQRTENASERGGGERGRRRRRHNNAKKLEKSEHIHQIRHHTSQLFRSGQPNTKHKTQNTKHRQTGRHRTYKRIIQGIVVQLFACSRLAIKRKDRTRYLSLSRCI